MRTVQLRTAVVVALAIAIALSPVTRAAEIDDQAAAARGAINDSESERREVMAHLYTLDQNIKASSKRALILSRRATEFELEARSLGREVRELETRSSERGRQMNARLSSLYRRRLGADALKSIFASESPAQLDRHQRYLRLMIDDDRHQMDAFVSGLREAREHRQKLSRSVRRLVTAQRAVKVAETELAQQRGEKQKLVTAINATRDSHLTALRALRTEGAVEDLAFFERRGSLENPVAGPVTRAFGAVNDSNFKFKLMHKGWFYGATGAAGARVQAIAAGRVEVARELPGWGPTVVIDHGDHYHSVYACAARIKVREGDVITAGQLIGFTGERSPLFGPGLYFELRHFADAIDPRTWIKDPNFTTAVRN